MPSVIDASPELDVSKLLSALRAVRKGDFSVRLPDNWTGMAGKVADTLNEVIELNERFAEELQRLSTVVGQRGRIQERAALGPVTGAWAESVSNVNSLVASLVQPTNEAAHVIGAVAKGDLSQRIALEVDGRPLEGEFLRTARTVNRVVDQLGAFAAEVTRVVREVGTEGKLGGQARVEGVSGTWRDLTDSVNYRFNPTHHAFLDQLMESIAIVINTIEANTRTEDLLKQSQSLASELQQTNQELQEKARLLAHQNAEVEQARQALEEKAAQLALTSKYKSEFLASMSHELRTPLNSLLILSDQLSRNPEGNLSGKQMDYAKTIHSSGNDLLNLINDILDLSKIESGTVVADVGELCFTELHGFVERTFNHVAESKNLRFSIDLHPELPRAIQTDAKRLQQILKNLLSNAFKFTRHGRVALAIGPAAGVRFESENRRTQEFVIGFAVSDTGIGIATDKQQIIFEAFQQADGSTSRKYGGTGLGLAISRELARLLGGEIQLASVPGQGSTFTLFLPGGFIPAPPRRSAAIETSAAPSREAVASALPEPAQPVDEVGDDRAEIAAGDRVLLIVENDLTFARTILDAAHRHGCRGIITGFGAAALTLTERFAPEAITLDISLPDISGWRILERLKHAPATRHIPVYVITTEEDRARGLRSGALGFATKPLASLDAVDHVIESLRRYVDDPMRYVLVVDPDPARRTEICGLLERPDTHVIEAASEPAALAALGTGRVDCLVLNPALTESADALLERLLAAAPRPDVPVLMYRGQALPEQQAVAVKRLGQHGILKEVMSPDRLLDQVTLFLHRRFDELSDSQRQTIHDLHSGDKSLAGRKVLIVDDDIRNIFALTSILEQHQMVTAAAETGRDAIGALERTPDIEAVLMDVMMPEMDGLDATRAVRRNPRFRELPIIAVTAKAMRGDRERCIEAGAWDYLSKPVDPDELLAMLRAWLVR